MTAPASSSLLRRGRLTALEHRLATDLAARPEPEVLWPVVSALVDEADRIAEHLEAWVARRPDWPRPKRDLAWAVPADPGLSVPMGADPAERRPWEQHGGPTPEGRHRGKTAVLAFRSTPASPGHLLRRAMERAGIEVRVVERIDLDAHADADFVLIVESPLPPIKVIGTSAVPIVFWVHHGEHHLDGNLRLEGLYAPDLILLAHSWHLAARFSAPVERFPFAVAPELTQDPSWSGRDIDLAFVGGLGGVAYRRRRQLISEAENVLRNVEAVNGIGPREMMMLYRRARMVLNEGGTRHLPITMRVFEAIAAGALLVTDPAPGLDELFDGRYFEIAGRELDADRITGLLASSDAETIAREAYEHAMRLHTYDHRVDLLLRYVDRIVPGDRERTPAPETPIEAFFVRHPYAQRVLDAAGRAVEPGKEIWRPHDLVDDPKPGSFDIAVLTGRSAPALALAARRYVIGWDIDPDDLGLSYRSVSSIEDLIVVDLGADAYDVATVGGPSAFD